jgi:hypothetical protein
LGKYIPQLVEIFLRKYFKEGQTILDPFCGSGTTLVQAQEMGINGIGCDISAFNILLTKVKTQDYNLSLLKKEVLDIMDKTAYITKNVEQGSLFGMVSSDKNSEFHPSEYLVEWFAPRALYELLTYNSLIANYEYQDILKIILSRSARSARLTTHFDLDFPKKPQTEPYDCYKHRRICKPTEEAYKFLYRYSLDTITRVEEYAQLKKTVKIELINGDSRLVAFPEADGIITSPPYVGLIDYHDQHRYAYELLNIHDKSDSEIGAASNGKSIKAKDAFKQGIIDVFKNARRSIKKDGLIIIVAGDRDNLYPEIQESMGMPLVDKLERHVNRRTGRRSNHFFESIFIFSNT